MTTTTKRVYVTFTKDELEAIEREADKLGLTKSAYVHMVYKQALSHDIVK